MDDIHGLKPYMYFAPSWKLMLLVFVILVALGALAGWLLRNRPEEEPDLEPEPARAPAARSVRQQLDALRDRRLIEAGRVREFHGELSAILRAFLGERFGLPGRRLTTTEILAALSRERLEDEPYGLIANFLPSCDLAKFADARPGTAQMEGLLADAYRIVDLLGDAPTPFEEADGAYV